MIKKYDGKDEQQLEFKVLSHQWKIYEHQKKIFIFCDDQTIAAYDPISKIKWHRCYITRKEKTIMEGHLASDGKFYWKDVTPLKKWWIRKEIHVLAKLPGEIGSYFRNYVREK